MERPMPGDPGVFWNGPAWSRRVRGLRYLWGSAGATVDPAFARPPLLHVTNDLAGQPVAIGTRTAAGALAAIATLQPGECLSLELGGIAGITADCGAETLVHCLLC